MITKYVAGFMFDMRNKLVALVQKDRPNWQKGLFNAIGGHVEENEAPLDAMVREFKEETGLVTAREAWRHYAKLTGSNDGGWEVDWFWALSLEKTLREARAPGVEPIYVLATTAVSGRYIPTVANLPWLLEMALVSISGVDRCGFHLITEHIQVALLCASPMRKSRARKISSAHAWLFHWMGVTLAIECAQCTSVSLKSNTRYGPIARHVG